MYHSPLCLGLCRQRAQGHSPRLQITYIRIQLSSHTSTTHSTQRIRCKCQTPQLHPRGPVESCQPGHLNIYYILFWAQTLWLIGVLYILDGTSAHHEVQCAHIRTLIYTFHFANACIPTRNKVPTF